MGLNPPNSSGGGSSAGGGGGTSSNFGAALPAAGTAAGYSDGTNMQAPLVFDADTGAGTQYVAGSIVRISANGGSIEAKGQQVSASSLPVVIASDQSAVPASQFGTWNIGSITTLPALAAGANLAGQFGLLFGMGATDTNGVERQVTVGFANVAAASTDSSLVAASGSTRVYLLACVAVCGGTATTLVFNSKPAGAGTAISCTFALAANGGFVLPRAGDPWAVTSASQGLTVTTGAGSTIGLQFLYAQF